MSLLTLPPDIRRYLFPFLHVRTVIKLSETCSIFRTLAREQKLWFYYFRRDFKVEYTGSYPRQIYQVTYVAGYSSSVPGWFIDSIIESESLVAGLCDFLTIRKYRSYIFTHEFYFGRRSSMALSVTLGQHGLYYGREELSCKIVHRSTRRVRLELTLKSKLQPESILTWLRQIGDLLPSLDHTGAPLGKEIPELGLKLSSQKWAAGARDHKERLTLVYS